MRITKIFRKKIYNAQEINWKVEKGVPYPLGVTPQKNGINFSVISEHATSVTLAIFKPYESIPFFKVTLDTKQNKTGSVWHIFIDGIEPNMKYGYYVSNYHNGEILLLDPYSKNISGAQVWGKNTKRYSAIPQNDFDWKDDKRPQIPKEKMVIYEMHVRGFTKDSSSKAKNKGTFRGIIEKIPYLRCLGITSVEFLPIFDFDETDNVYVNPYTGNKLRNFWGYNTINFFVPKASYSSSPNAIKEFKEMVYALHRAGIEVILDIVFNHTAEGNRQGSDYHFKGFDKKTYYILDENGNYMNFSGCGNTVNCNHPVVSDLIVDCLRYWYHEMHVDGFRFDLASILTRDTKGHVMKRPHVIDRISKDPILKKAKLIAEAWDAAGLYQVGNFPSYGNWSEWNGKFRDDIRSFMKGDQGCIKSFALRVAGSPDIYGYSGNATSSINFITCHDGFTLNDLVSYNEKHNEENGENNNDGERHNRSWNCGEEGESRNAKVLKLRKKQIKNFISILFLSQGIPMLLSGDEIRRTKRGNNNTYCQDNKLSWLDWNLIRKHKDILKFTQKIIDFRKAHPILHQSKFATKEGCKGLSWHGTKIGSPDWSDHSHSIAFLYDGRVLTPIDDDIYVAVNAFWSPLKFEIPPSPSKRKWKLIIDTAKDFPKDIIYEKKAKYYKENNYTLQPRSIVVLVT